MKPAAWRRDWSSAARCRGVEASGWPVIEEGLPRDEGPPRVLLQLQNGCFTYTGSIHE
jgi:hypothetical protein